MNNKKKSVVKWFAIITIAIFVLWIILTGYVVVMWNSKPQNTQTNAINN